MSKTTLESLEQIEAVIKMLLPNGTDNLLKARMEALRNMSSVTYEGETAVVILGAVVSIKITFDERHRP